MPLLHTGKPLEIIVDAKTPEEAQKTILNLTYQNANRLLSWGATSPSMYVAYETGKKITCNIVVHSCYQVKRDYELNAITFGHV